MSSRTQAISPILRVTKLSFEYDKVFTKEKMKFNNGDEIFTKKLIRSKAKLTRLVTQMNMRTVERGERRGVRTWTKWFQVL